MRQPSRASSRRRISPLGAVVGLTIVGSLAFIAYAVFGIDEGQLGMLMSGFFVLGGAFTVGAVGLMGGIWRAASRANSRRATALAVGGGIAAVCALGSFAVAVIFALLANV